MSRYQWGHDHAADEARRQALVERGIDPKLIAIDPRGCGCTECLIGEYKPLEQASEAEMRALFDGLLNDNADVSWSIDQAQSWVGSGFDVYAEGHSFHVESLELPLDLEYYRLTVGPELVQSLLDGETLLR